MSISGVSFNRGKKEKRCIATSCCPDKITVRQRKSTGTVQEKQRGRNSVESL